MDMASGHQITITPTGQHIEVFLGGEKLASSDRPVVLAETGLPDRYYPSAARSPRARSQSRGQPVVTAQESGLALPRSPGLGQRRPGDIMAAGVLPPRGAVGGRRARHPGEPGRPVSSPRYRWLSTALANWLKLACFV